MSDNLYGAELFRIDILPPGAGVEAQMLFDSRGHPNIRFRVFKRRLGTFFLAKRFEWSGWFHYEGEPIQLEWRVLTAA